MREKYGTKSAVQAINAAIRNEMPGGAELLVLIGETYHNLTKINDPQDKKIITSTYIGLRVVREKMELEICKKYDLEQRRPANDSEKTSS
ncbi:MAG: hypothetical protein Q4G69_11240 [Planctomycetia bacterium]|nr:hypothetical protein [Planctomycetia bacterium]